MSKKINPTAVGIFVTGAIACTMLGVFLLARDSLHESRRLFVAYFQSSANGLQEGSDVLIGGVKIGSVEKMYIDFDPETDQRVIPVVIRLFGDKISALRPASSLEEEREDVLSDASFEEAISRGLCAQLKSKSALTGQLYVDLDFLPVPTAYYNYPAKTVDGLMQIPTTKNQIEQVLETIASGLDGLGDVDISGLIDHTDSLIVNLDKAIMAFDVTMILESARTTLENIDRAIVEGDLKGAIASISKSANEIDALVTSIQGEKINAAFERTNEAMDEVGAASAKVGAASDDLARLTNKATPATEQVNQTLSEIEDAARSLRELADYLKRNPNALITGKKKP